MELRNVLRGDLRDRASPQPSADCDVDCLLVMAKRRWLALCSDMLFEEPIAHVPQSRGPARRIDLLERILTRLDQAHVDER